MSGWKRAARRVVALAGSALAGFAAVGSATAAERKPGEAGGGWNFGPLWSDIRLTLAPGDGVEAAGPFFYWHDRGDETGWGLPPLVSATTSKDGETAQWFVLPPLFSWRKYGPDSRWQVLQLLTGGHLDKIDDPDLKRFTLFPFVFYQDAPNPARDFWALFPLYGTIQGRLYRDEIEFAGFPLWLKSRKGATVTRNVLFPVVHWREGPGLKGWQVWPLAGHEHREPSTRTNLVEDLEIVPGYDKTFGAWPIWFRNWTGLGTTNVMRVDALLPLYYVERSPQRDHTEVGWPFISWMDDRKARYRQWNVPWPFVAFARGEGKTLDRVLPLFSVGHTPTYESQLYLWPTYRRRHTKTDSYDKDRWQIGVVLYSDLTEGNPQTGLFERRIDSWPWFSWSKDKEGNERWQALSLIEPMKRGLGIERTWSPVWSLWRQERHGRTGAEMQSFLWNLYRRESAGGTTKGSLLFGLVQYETSPAGRRWRWFHFGSRIPSPRAADPADAGARAGHK